VPANRIYPDERGIAGYFHITGKAKKQRETFVMLCVLATSWLISG
jgi:hypothetical protein